MTVAANYCLQQATEPIFLITEKEKLPNKYDEHTGKIEQKCKFVEIWL